MSQYSTDPLWRRISGRLLRAVKIDSKSGEYEIGDGVQVLIEAPAHVAMAQARARQALVTCPVGLLDNDPQVREKVGTAMASEGLIVTDGPMGYLYASLPHDDKKAQEEADAFRASNPEYADKQVPSEYRRGLLKELKEKTLRAIQSTGVRYQDVSDYVPDMPRP